MCSTPLDAITCYDSHSEGDSQQGTPIKLNKVEAHLLAMLQRLDIDPILRNRDEIYIAQRAVYELSMTGIDVGYYFGDYPVGKFSPELRDVQIELHNTLLLGGV